jgi:aminocarboxymuconate-semialdehyde decarboxylase
LPKALKKRPSDYFKMFYADTALSGSVGATRCGLDYFGERQVIFASDFPFDAEGGAYLIRATVHAIDALNLAPASKAAINYDNLIRLLTPALK